eukprot:1156834-Pelagomonas_calceolata.AAC.1
MASKQAAHTVKTAEKAHSGSTTPESAFADHRPGHICSVLVCTVTMTIPWSKNEEGVCNEEVSGSIRCGWGGKICPRSVGVIERLFP